MHAAIEKRNALPQLRAARSRVKITGTAPLMVCSWMTRLTRAGLPDEEQSELARYRLPNGKDGIPYAMFRGALTRAAIRSDQHTGGIFLGDESSMFLPLSFRKEDLWRTTVSAKGKSKPFVRVVYEDWSVSLLVEYQEPIWTAGSLVALLNDAGSTVGIGQMRPEHSGTFGTFRVEI